jgi:hypothetical protein
MGAPLSPDLEDGSKLQIHVPEDMAEMWVDVTSPVPRGVSPTFASRNAGE